jgi:hypothetical protein
LEQGDTGEGNGNGAMKIKHFFGACLLLWLFAAILSVWAVPPIISEISWLLTKKPAMCHGSTQTKIFGYWTPLTCVEWKQQQPDIFDRVPPTKSFTIPATLLQCLQWQMDGLAAPSVRDFYFEQPITIAADHGAAILVKNTTFELMFGCFPLKASNNSYVLVIDTTFIGYDIWRQ